MTGLLLTLSVGSLVLKLRVGLRCVSTKDIECPLHSRVSPSAYSELCYKKGTVYKGVTTGPWATTVRVFDVKESRVLTHKELKY